MLAGEQWRTHTGDGRETPRIGGTAGDAHAGWRIDDRCLAPRDDRLGFRQSLAAEISVANRIEHEDMRR